jgi:hypothetical protein
MANIPIYDGTSDFTAYSASAAATASLPPPTAFGFYNNDVDFKSDADKVTTFCARRLGWPIENVELQDIQFWTAFEEAVTVYGNELYAFKQREDYISMEGSEFSYASGVEFSETLVTPNFQNIVRLSDQYGEQAGVGGNVTWYSGSIYLTQSVQDYDLNVWASQSLGISGSQLEIKRIFYEGIPASAQYFAAGGAGLGAMGGATGFMGFGGVPGYGMYNTYLMSPLSYNVQAIQATELAQDILFDAYSFELINNQLRIFPIPGTGEDGNPGQLWFQYTIVDQVYEDSLQSGSALITNISQYPYNNPIYSTINSVGRAWIFEYTLALVKEMLGYVRGKYSTVPIPGAEVTLNQGDLITSATATKDALIVRLREYFDQTSRQSMLERRAAESVARVSEINNVPMTIFIG